MSDRRHVFTKKSLDEESPSKHGGKETSSLPKEREKEIERELSVIYENTDGTMPDMSEFIVAPKRGVWRALLTLIFTCACFAAVAWFGFVVFAPKTGFDEARVVFSVSGDETAVIGEEVGYRIRYENTGTSPLAQVKLEVRFPEGFIMATSSLPPTQEGGVWELGTLNSGQSGVIDISGRMYGNFAEKQSVRAFLTYLPSTFSSPFQKVATLVTELSESPMSVLITLPEDISTGIEVPISFTIRKNGEGVLPAVAFELGGNTLRLVKSEPKTEELERKRWAIPPGNKEFTVKVGAIFTRSPDGAPPMFEARILGWTDTARKEDSFIITSTERAVVLVDTAVRTTLVINGSNAPVQVSPGEALQTTLVVKNTGEAPMTNASIRLVFDAPSFKNRSMLSWQELVDEAEGSVLGEQLTPTKRRGSITWTSKNIPALANLKPGEQVSIDLSLPLKDTSDSDIADYPTGPILVTPEVRYARGGTTEVVSLDPRSLSVVSNVSLAPTVSSVVRGSETDYTVKWVVNNTFHDLKDLRLEADLYGNIAWNQAKLSVPAGTATFDPQTKKLVWIIPSMPESVDVNALQFAFTLKEKNPTQTELISKIRLTATDATANEPLIRVGENTPLEVQE